MTATETIRELSHSFAIRYSGDCLTHARTIAAMLRAEGREAWIGRVRHVEQRGSTTFHHPLIPKTVVGANYLAWTTHYVACADHDAYDPLLGDPIDIDDYAMKVFGLPLEIEMVSRKAEPESRRADAT